MDLLVRRPAEIKRRLSMKDMFLTTILENGKVLYDRAN
jgi:hypothetical protein